MRKSTLLNRLVAGAMCFFFLQGVNAQVTFTATSAGLQPVSATSYADCAADMNQDGLDDIVRVTSAGIYIDYQNEDGSFTPFFQSMAIQNLPSWSICAADIDGNGFTDLLLGAGNAVSFVYASDDGTSFTEDAFPEYIFTQRSTFADIDNDGNLDSFCCHDVDQCHPYRNVNGVLELDMSLITTLDVGGNYAAIWVDYDNDWDIDLYITKCRGGAAVGDPQRINLLYRNDGNGVFTSVGPEANMNDGDQSWATSFEDFDNDGDFDAFTVNHAWANRLMENNGDGTFTDIISGSGINAADLGAWNCDAGDFDNNGFVDIFSEMATEMYWNNGNGTFSGENLSFNSGGIGDFNNDGFLDVVAGNTMYMNNGNNNNYVKFNLQGLMSNKTAVGARIEIYGDWGIQIREVRAGESFDPASSLITHFGLGSSTSIDQVVVKWPSGMITSIDNPTINTTHDVLEVSCLLDPVSIAVDGNTSICEGQSVTLSAPAGNSYAWSNGATTQSIEADAQGTFSVIVFDEEGCAAMSDQVIVDVIEEETPVIAAQGETFFCEGGSVILTSTVGASYTWSNGGNGQAIEVSESGIYHVDIAGACSGTALSSNTIEVTVLAAPAPVVTDVQIGEPGTATLSATGNNLEWFATETSTEVLGTGETFETPFFDNTVSYWVQSTTNHFGEQQSGGKADVTGAGGLPATGGRLFFNATEEFTLLQVT
ncbi:MAG: FG-GAP-like repeat-containing protein, partial [Flavobacteriales bacterium]